MPLMPIRIGSRMRLIDMPAGAGNKEQAQVEEENLRRVMIARRREYYSAEQYDLENAQKLSEKGADSLLDRLPEHDRKHAYSTQIESSVNFIADQIAESFAAEADADDVQTVIDSALRGSDQFTGPNDEDEVSVETVLRDALVAGDVAVELRWDPVDGTAFYECWESEQVEFTYATRRRVEKVTREEVIWVEDIDGDRQVLERVVYDLTENLAGDTECRRQVFWDEDEQPRDTTMLGVPFIPWRLLRGMRLDLRGLRGDSIISEQAMQHADRYNANEQNAYIIGRYNSHGNLAVIGDAAMLEARQEQRVSKDVADVLTFPGGTALTSITLPTDPAMIEHQRKVLADAIFETFGLTRVDQETVSTGRLGAISGYALEILNRRTEGTFRRIRRAFVSDLRSLFSMTLDLTAYMREVTFQDADGNLINVDEFDPDVELADMPIPQLGEVDPDQVFPNREVEIRLGTGYIVDDVLARDDFLAKLISRSEALRQRGYTDEQITEIEDELEGETPDVPEVGGFFGQPASNGNDQGGEGEPTPTQAGRTVGTATEE